MIKTIRQCSNLMIILKGSANLHSIVEWCYLISTSGIRLLDLTSSLSWSFGDDMPTSIPTQSWTLTDQRAHMTKDRPTPSDKEHLMRSTRTRLKHYRFQSIPSKGQHSGVEVHLLVAMDHYSLRFQVIINGNFLYF